MPGVDFPLRWPASQDLAKFSYLEKRGLDLFETQPLSEGWWEETASFVAKQIFLHNMIALICAVKVIGTRSLVIVIPEACSSCAELHIPLPLPLSTLINYHLPRFKRHNAPSHGNQRTWKRVLLLSPGNFASQLYHSWQKRTNKNVGEVSLTFLWSQLHVPFLDSQKRKKEKKIHSSNMQPRS